MGPVEALGISGATTAGNREFTERGLQVLFYVRDEGERSIGGPCTSVKKKE